MTEETKPSHEWVPFSSHHPRNGKKILIKLADGRELKGERIHVELIFDDVMQGKISENRWDLQLISTCWKYI